MANISKENQAIIKLLVSAALANADEISSSEEKFLLNVHEILEVDKSEVEKLVNEAKNEILKLEGEQFDSFINEIAKTVSEDNRSFAFELVLSILMSDNVYDFEEVSFAAVAANALGLETAEVIASVAEAVKANQKLELAFAEN